MDHYDFIIAGAGCAGLSLVSYLLGSSLQSSKILLIDPSTSIPNKTWCYWSENPLAIHPAGKAHCWNSISISSPGIQLSRSLDKLKYYHLSSQDFYTSLLDQIRKHPSVAFLKDEVTPYLPQNDQAEVVTQSGKKMSANRVFDSIGLKTNSKSILRQVFLGWKITTNREVFHPHEVTLMDIQSISKKFEFFYILPFSTTHALVEFTTYSSEPVDRDSLQKELETYLSQKLGLEEYEISYEEKGSIPMTTQVSPSTSSSRIIPIGTAAGWIKPSTGYGFATIQENCQTLVRNLEINKSNPKKITKSNRFDFYDNILLTIAHKWPDKLEQVFLNLFQTSSGDEVLNFLGEKTTLSEEVQLLSRLKFPIFIKSLLHYEKY